MSTESSSAEQPAPKPPSPAQRWRGGQRAAGSGRGTSSRGRQLFVLVAVLLALGGAALAWLLFVRGLPAPYVLSLPIREYTARQLPANAFAVQDSDVLLQHFPGDHKKAYDSQTLDRIRKELSALRSKADTPVVVHLTALALRHEDDVYLLPGDADPDRPETWLALRDVLRALRQCPSGHKLLLLDIMKPIANPRLGVLVDDVAGRVKSLVEKENDPQLLVLCACEGKQVSHVSEEAGLSIFAFYLDQGLRGHADGWGEGSRDGRITVKELAAFVRERVQRWVWQNRGSRQAPTLLGSGPDFPLVSYEHRQLPPVADPVAEATMPSWLRAGWEAREKAWRDDSYRMAPLGLRRLQATLLRADERWRGGKEEVDLKTELAAELERFDEQLKLTPSDVHKQPRSLHLTSAVKPDAKVDAELRQAIRALLDKMKPVDEAKPADLKGAKNELVQKFQSVAHARYAWVIFDTATKLTSPTSEQLSLLQELLEKRNTERQHTETVFLDRLKALADKVADMNWKWPTATVQQALAAFRQAESTAADLAADPFLLPWVRDAFAAAEKKRREAEKYLFSERPSSWDYADAALRDATQRLGKLEMQVRLLRAARQQWDRSMTLLPTLAALYSSPCRLDPREERAWNAAIRATNKLADWLMAADPKALESDDDPSREVRANLGTLERHTAERVKRLLGRPESVEDYLEIQWLLASPIPTAAEREALWRAGRKVACQLHAKTRALDQADQQRRRSGDLGVPAEDPVAAREQALRRARLSIDLAVLTGLKESHALVPELEKRRQKPELSVEGLAGPLRDFWAKQLPRAYKGAANDPPLADRLARLLPPFEQDREGASDPQLWSRNPTRYLYNQQVLEFVRWLRERYLAESSAIRDDGPSKTFYEEAAAGR